METTIVYWGLYWNNGKANGNYYLYWGYMGIMEKQMETTIVYWGCIGMLPQHYKAPIYPYAAAIHRSPDEANTKPYTAHKHTYVYMPTQISTCIHVYPYNS